MDSEGLRTHFLFAEKARKQAGDGETHDIRREEGLKDAEEVV